MKNKYSDERLDKMLGNLLGSEVPEDMQFKNEISGEIIVAVKKQEHHTRRKIFTVCASLAAALCIAVPVWNQLNSLDKPFDDNESGLSEAIDDGLMAEIDKFNEDRADFGFISIPLANSDYYRNFVKEPAVENYNTPETGILLSLGLIPYEIIETEGKELFVKVISSGGKTIFTEDAYVAGYDSEGNINYLLHTSESISGEEAVSLAETDLFKGDTNSRSGFQKIVSKFNNKDTPVKIDGITVREQLDSNTECELMSGELHALVRKNGELVPVNIFELDYKVGKKLRINDDIPDFLQVSSENGKTNYYGILAYDCTKANSIRISLTKKENLWPVNFA
jgi:hypothetical protein